MAKHYKHLSQAERKQVAQLYWEGKKLGTIAEALNRDKSRISRETKRNSPPEYKRYRPCRAQARSCERKSQANTHRSLKNYLIEHYVRKKLAVGWSPELIAGRLRIAHPRYPISHEAIYQYIYHPQTHDKLEMINQLRRAHKKRRAKGLARKERKTKIPNRNSIDARPKSVDRRRQYGHWDGR